MDHNTLSPTPLTFWNMDLGGGDETNSLVRVESDSGRVELLAMDRWGYARRLEDGGFFRRETWLRDGYQVVDVLEHSLSEWEEAGDAD